MARKRRWGWLPLALAWLLGATVQPGELRAVTNVHDLSAELYSEIRDLLSMHRALHQVSAAP